MKLSIHIVIAAALISLLTVGCSRQEAKEQDATAPSSASVITLDEASFDSEVQTGVVLVDFWATWCGPCKTQGPIVEQVALQVAGKAKVAKLDVDTAPTIAKRFNVRSIPTLIVFKDGQPGKQFVGVTKAEVLVSAITSALNSE